MRQTINIGSAPNDGTGDPLRNAYDKCNDNFLELYDDGGVNITVNNPVTLTETTLDVALSDLVGGGATPNLQQVLTEGDRPIKLLDSFTPYTFISGDEAKFCIDDDAEDKTIPPSVFPIGAELILQSRTATVNILQGAGVTINTSAGTGNQTLELGFRMFLKQTALNFWEFNKIGFSASSGGGATNLGYTASPTDGIVTSDTGTDATLPLADATNAGLLKPEKYTVLENTSGTNTGDNATNTQYSGLAASKEDVANKTDVMAGNTANSTKYLSTKGVFDYIVSLAYLTIASASATYQTLASFASDVRATVLTGFSASAGTVSSADSILTAFNKIVGNIALKSDKSTSAYSMKVNNTNATANEVEVPYRSEGQQAYTDTVTFTAGVAPSGAENKTFNWKRDNNWVKLVFNGDWATTGTTITQAIIPIPSGVPNPVVPTGFTGASVVLFTGIGQMSLTLATATVSPSDMISFVRRNAADNGFEFVIAGQSGTYKVFKMTIEYPIS